MQKIVLSGTDLAILPLGLGTVRYGTALPEAGAFAQLDRFTEVGNLIDTAHVYGDWVPGTHARSEEVIGRWLKTRGGRSRVVISTKGAHPRLETMNIPRLSAQEIREDLEDSLRTLQTDYIDLYFLHRDDPTRPVEEILTTLETLRREGKIRWYGCSNWKLPRLMEAHDCAKRLGYAGFVCNQLMWSLADICFDNLSDKSFVLMDAPTFAFHRETQLGAIAYIGLAKGYFARRHSGAELPPRTQAVYGLPENDRIYARLRELSAAYGLSMTALSILYFAAQPFAAAPLASYGNMAHLEEGIEVLTRDIPQALLDEMKTIKVY